MIRFYRYCYKKFICQRPQLYIEITNESHFPIFFILQYTIHGGTATKESPVFGYAHKGKLIFSPGSQNVCFNVLKKLDGETEFICNIALSNPVTSYFKVIEDESGQLHCIQI